MATEKPTTFDFGPVKIDPIELGSQGNAVLGIRDSGKSYTAMKLAEMLFDAGIPFIAFDPIGVWRYLRVPGRGKGYPIVVAGGEEGDLPLSPQTAPMIVEAAMQNGVSLVIDLFDMKLSKADWRAIVRDCVRLLLHRNKAHGLRHVFLEEAAEFAPQKVFDGLVYAEIEKLARMGGNSRLGYTLINQRAQEVNKAVLELCDNLFLHRQKGKNALEGVKKWLDIAGATATDVMRSLPTLAQGECWAWMSGSDTPVHLIVPEKNSLHPDRRMMHGDVVAKSGKAVKVDRFVAALQKTLPALEDLAKANDPVALRAEITRLERQLAASGKAPAYPDRSEEVSMLNGALIRVQEQRDALQRHIIAAAKALGLEPPVFDKVDPVVKYVAPRGSDIIDGPNFGSRTFRLPDAQPASPENRVQPGELGSVPSGCAKPLAVLAGAYPAGMTEGQWATAAGYKRTGGTWKEYRSRLTRAGMIEKNGDRYFATEHGANSAGTVETPPTPGPDLARWWRPRINVPERVMEILIAAYPIMLSRDELADKLEMEKTGGSFKEYVSRLKRNEIAVESGQGIVLTEAVMGS